MDSDNCFVDNYSVSGNKIHIEYEMEFIMQTFLDSEFIWRVQGCARAKFSIPGPDLVDWSVFDAEDHDFLRIMINTKNLYSLIRSLILMSNVIQSANNISMTALLLNFFTI